MNRERGSATIWVVACLGLIGAVAFVATVQAAAILSRHRAETAADLAALAAAGQIGVAGDPCGEAKLLASANDALVTACDANLAEDGLSGDVRVQVARDVHLPVVGVRHVTARAHAQREPKRLTAPD